MIVADKRLRALGDAICKNRCQQNYVRKDRIDYQLPVVQEGSYEVVEDERHYAGRHLGDTWRQAAHKFTAKQALAKSESFESKRRSAAGKVNQIYCYYDGLWERCREAGSHDPPVESEYGVPVEKNI